MDKIKLLLVSAGVVIVLLVVIKLLNFAPSELTAGLVTVKFPGLPPTPGLAPIPGQPNATPSVPPRTENTAIAENGVNIAGEWKAGQNGVWAWPLKAVVTQAGNQVTITLSNQNGSEAVCHGTLGGLSLQV